PSRLEGGACAAMAAQSRHRPERRGGRGAPRAWKERYRSNAGLNTITGMLAATRSSDRVSAAGNPDDPLAALNAAQREAVLHGLGGGAGGDPPPPLLVIAGAGSGKTNTLAHRVAH